MHTILIADDSTTIQRAVEIVFDKEPFSVVKAGSGAEAVARAKDARPALVLVDHLMSDKTGYEVAEALRADPSTSQIPILILSGSSAPFDEGRAKAAGVLGHVPKPFDCTTLLERVKTILGVTASGPVAGATPVAATPAAVAATPRPPSVPGFGRPAAAAAAPAAISSIPTAAPRSATPMPSRDLDPFGFGKGLSNPPAAASAAPISVAPVASAAAPVTTAAKPTVNPFGASPSGPPKGMTSSAPAAAVGLSATDERWSTGGRADPGIDVAMDDFSSLNEPAKPSSQSGTTRPLGDKRSAASLSDAEFMEVSDHDVTPSSASPLGAGVDDGKATSRVDVARLQEMDRIAAATSQASRSSLADSATSAVTAAAAPAIAAATGAAPSQGALTAEARAIVEKIAWEVVPELAETIIREEIKRLLASK